MARAIRTAAGQTTNRRPEASRCRTTCKIGTGRTCSTGWSRFSISFPSSWDPKEKKKSEEEKAAEQQRRQQQEAELAERRRRIQEEIRRRMTGETPAGDTAPRTPQPAAPEAARPLAPRPVPTPVRPPPQHVPSEVAPAEPYESDIERRLAAQREELKRARSARAAAHRQADAITAGVMTGDLSQGAGEISSSGTAAKSGAKEMRGDILQAVRSHRNLRSAVVLTEILGPPMASRPEIGQRLF